MTIQMTRFGSSWRRIATVAGAIVLLAGLVGTTACSGAVEDEVGEPPVAGVDAPVDGDDSDLVVADAKGARSCKLDISGTWKTSQGNNYHVTFDFKQSGTTLTGSATLPADEQRRAGYSGPTGVVAGTVKGDKLDLVVTWPARADGTVVKGRYYGDVKDGKIAKGKAYDLAVKKTYSFNGTGPSRCVSSCTPDVTGTWATTQGNNYHPTFALTQRGTAVTGTATLSEAERARAGYNSATGSVAGTIKGNTLDIVVTWPPKGAGPATQGRYTGTIENGRIVQGSAIPVGISAPGTSWTGSGPSRCA
jgi:hypothetical protein